MLASLPAVPNDVPFLEKSMVLMVLLSSRRKNNFFMDGMCQYSRVPSESAVTSTLLVVLINGRHFRVVTEFSLRQLYLLTILSA